MRLGSPVLRAASCAWLLARCSEAAEKHERLSFAPGLAIGVSELGRGDSEDIYPGLYTQATLDDLLELAHQDLDAILLSRQSGRRRWPDRTHGHRCHRRAMDGPWRHQQAAIIDLLDRQLHILQRVIAPRRPRHTAGVFCLFKPSVYDHLQTGHPLIALG